MTGHMGIVGNELADAQAKLGIRLPIPADTKPTLAHIRRNARQKAKDSFAVWWKSAAPSSYKELKLDTTISRLRELSLPRPILHHLLAARTGHGDIAEYQLISP